MYLKNLFILITFLQINFGYTQNCDGSYPVYYTEDTIKVFQSMDSESAVLTLVPKGEAVKVLSSFFGSSTGFWQICWNGFKGYSLKNQLTFDNINKNISKSKDIQTTNQELEFNPFLGQTSTAVNFRTGPSSSETKISTLGPGSTLYVYSNETVNGYYKAIDIMSNEIGWVHNKYVIYVQEVEVNETGMFQSTGYSSNYNSEVTIENKSSYTIKLIVDSETFILSPNTTKSLNISPGRKYYIASAPGVIPASGYQSFESNNGYEWSFWVSTSRY